MVAMENGWFEEEGIIIEEVIGSEGGGTTVRNVSTGGVPIGEVATPAAVNGFYAGAGIELISGGQKGLTWANWVSKPGSNITSIQDLEGGVAGFTSPGSVSQSLIAICLNRAEGISPADVEQQSMGGLGEGLTALAGGDIDAMIHIEPLFSQQTEGDTEYNVLFWTSEFVPTLMHTLIIVDARYLEDNGETVRSFLKVRRRAIKYIQNESNRGSYANLYASYLDGFTPSIIESSFQNFDPNNDYAEIGYSLEALKEEERAMNAANVNDRAFIKWSEILNQEYIPEDRRVDLTQAEMN
jgi:NitT/TauT family transport system substrate-binding protein